MHPTRLGRHGGALVKASFWERERERELKAEADAAAGGGDAASAGDVKGGSAGKGGRNRRSRNGGGRGSPKWQRVVPREHVNLLKGRYADDHRVIDEDCGCPTCRGG